MIRINPKSNLRQARYSLTASIDVETISDGNWQGEGAAYLSDPCADAEAYCVDVCASNGPEPYGPDGKPAEDVTLTEIHLLEVVYGVQCTSRAAIDTAINLRNQARRGLEKKESKALESELWNGQCGGAFATPTVLCPGDQLKPRGALAALESALKDCDGPGIIHVPVALVNYIEDYIDDIDGRLFTKAGSLVVIGQGYGGDIAGSEFIYASGDIRLFRGDLRYSPDSNNFRHALDASQNKYIWRAERTWGIGLESCCDVFTVDTLFC